MKIILGSKSPWRKRMLEEQGFEVVTMSADLDEKSIRSTDPRELPLLLARAKADALLPQITDEALLLTFDSIAVWKEEIREKPESEIEARQFLKDYMEHPVQSFTAAVVTNTKTQERRDGVDEAFTHFKRMTQEEVDAIIADGCVYGCAGGFCVQHPLFQACVDHIDGEKESVAGFPLALTKRLISAMSV